MRLKWFKPVLYAILQQTYRCINAGRVPFSCKGTLLFGYVLDFVRNCAHFCFRQRNLILAGLTSLPALL
jgi:hypothetical protein